MNYLSMKPLHTKTPPRIRAGYLLAVSMQDKKGGDGEVFFGIFTSFERPLAEELKRIDKDKWKPVYALVEVNKCYGLY